MREILFRGRRKKGDKRWVEGDLTQGYAGYVGIVKWCCAGTSFEVVPETVGQYTGLTDKNGKKVFEGDILFIKCADGKLRPYPVYFGTYNAEDTYGADFHIGFYTKFYDEDIGLGFLADSNNQNNFEVIGNIYDNPELMGGEAHG